jgi:type IX secretion system PorP/SprF family membrane protein
MENRRKTYRLRLIPGIILLALMVSGPGVVPLNAQDPQFSQFYAAPLYIAPSFAGGTDGSRVVMNYRNQWPSIPGAFVTYAFSFDHYFHNYNSGVGLLIGRDEAGTGRLANNTASLLYSYNFQLDHRWTMRPGISFSYAERTIDFYRLTFGDQLQLNGQHNTSTFNPLINDLAMDRVGYFDAATSVMAYSSNAWVGVTVDHLMRPNQSMIDEQKSRVPMKYSLFGGYRFDYGGSLMGDMGESISLAVLYRNQGKFNQLDAGVYWSKHPISIGLLYRGIPIFNNHVHGLFNNDALVAMVGLRTKDFRIGYSYDMTISRLINSTGGSHEISLIYHFNQGPPNKKPKMLPCPD